MSRAAWRRAGRQKRAGSRRREAHGSRGEKGGRAGKAAPGGNDVPDVGERAEAEGEVAPLVRGGDERTHEAAHDEDPGHEDGRPDVREREADGERELEDEERKGDEPLDVADKLRGA